MALRNIGEGGGDFWSQFPQEGQQPDMANGGYMGTGGGETPQMFGTTPQPGDWQTMGGQQPGQAQGAAGGDVSAQVQALFAGKPLTPELLKQVLPQLQALGIHVQNEQRGDFRPRLLMPDKTTVDLGDWGGPLKWTPRGDMGDWHSGQGGGTLGQIGQAGGGDSRMDELRNTPGYQFSFDEGMRGVQNSAFAKGTGLTGGTLKRIAQYAGGLASQRYDTQNQQYLDWSKLGQNAVLGASS